MFNHEKLDVYRMAVSFDSFVGKLLPRRGARSIREQLERASCSVMACIAEGAGRWADALRNRGMVSVADYQHCRELLLSIVRILTRLSAPRDP